MVQEISHCCFALSIIFRGKDYLQMLFKISIKFVFIKNSKLTAGFLNFYCMLLKYILKEKLYAMQISEIPYKSQFVKKKKKEINCFNTISALKKYSKSFRSKNFQNIHLFSLKLYN